MAIDKFQKQQLKDFRSGKLSYDEASLYTILLDLCKRASPVNVFVILHNVACDMGKRNDLESKFDKAKEWKW